MQDRLNELLPLFGHRNWIVVTDAAYPAHSAAGIETVFAEGEVIEVARSVLAAIAGSGHVSPLVYTDAELAFVDETASPGVSRYRAGLDRLLDSVPRVSLPHEEIISRLDEAARRFRVLIIKTRLRIPYTSVFIELGCGYWGEEQERALRAAIEKAIDTTWASTKRVSS